MLLGTEANSMNALPLVIDDILLYSRIEYRKVQSGRWNELKYLAELASELELLKSGYAKLSA